MGIFIPSTSPPSLCTDAVRARHRQAIVSSIMIYQSRLPMFVSCLVSLFYVSLAAPLEVTDTVFFSSPPGYIPTRLFHSPINHPKEFSSCGVQVDTPAPFFSSLSSISRPFCLPRHQVRVFHHRSFRHLLFHSLIAFVTYSYCVYT